MERAAGRKRPVVVFTSFLVAVAAVVYLGAEQPGFRSAELLGPGDAWIAQEDGMALDVADELAKRCVMCAASRCPFSTLNAPRVLCTFSCVLLPSSSVVADRRRGDLVCVQVAPGERPDAP
jgi:hypothetical protein